MLFNSIQFPVFLLIVFTLYWLIPGKYLRLRNLVLLVSSYVFYGWWDWRFLSLIFFSSLVDYIVGYKIFREDKKTTRKLLLIISLFVNLGALGLFKYYNFFIDSFAEIVTMMGMKANIPSLRVILPVGISFYTFQTLSYSIDIYRKKIEPTRNIIAFFAFVSFFPQLVAGPIERAKSLLPQFLSERKFDPERAKDGLRQALWGFFKKIVIADNLSSYVDQSFSNYASLDSISLILGIIFFAFQIYCDFSGYSDIAIGISRLFGFSLMRNFAYPYFSRDIAEFWRRWHISLSSWFRDYVYIPMGGSYVGKFRRIWNIIVTFTVSGFWHGANWTFVVWGFINGIYYIPLMLRDKQKKNTEIVAQNSIFPSFSEIIGIIITFIMALFAWVFFRATSLSHAFAYIFSVFQKPFFGLDYDPFVKPIILIISVVVVEWFNRDKQHGLEISSIPKIFHWPIYYLVILTIVVVGQFGSQEFIYFQF